MQAQPLASRYPPPRRTEVVPPFCSHARIYPLCLARNFTGKTQLGTMLVIKGEPSARTRAQFRGRPWSAPSTLSLWIHALSYVALYRSSPSTDQRTIALDGETASHLRTGQVPSPHGASRNRSSITVSVNLMTRHRLSRHQQSEVVCACMRVAGRALAAAPAVARQFRRIN